jgi:hypothetical protein
VRKGEDGSEIYMNEQDEIICVRESVPMIRDLIIRAGGLVAAAQKIEGTASPIRLHPADQSLPKE